MFGQNKLVVVVSHCVPVKFINGFRGTKWACVQQEKNYVMNVNEKLEASLSQHVDYILLIRRCAPLRVPCEESSIGSTINIRCP